MPTIARILELAPVCSYLANNEKAKGNLFKGTTPKNIKNQATLIYIYWKILNKIYTLDPTYPGLQAPANYLFELEQRWAFKAASIVDGGGGGQIAPITPTVRPSRIEFEGSPTTFIPEGETTVQLPISWAGWDVELERSNVPQSTLSTQPMYFTYVISTRILTLSVAVQPGELIAIIPSV